MNVHKLVRFNVGSYIVGFTILSVISEIYSMRFLLEGVGIIVTILLINWKEKFAFSFIVVIQTLVHGELAGVASLSLVYYFLYANLLNRKSINIEDQISSFQLSFVYLAAALFVFSGFGFEYGRYVGFFNSPLAAAYFWGGLACYLLYSNRLVSVLSIFFGLITGSRSFVFLVVYPILTRFYKFFLNFYGYLFLLLGSFVLFYYHEKWIVFFDVIRRALSANNKSESGRLGSYIDWFNLDWNVFNFIFGFGRDYFGSLAVRLGSIDFNVPESSFMTLIGSYGIFGVGLFTLILYRTFLRKSMLWFLVLVLSSITVLLDSLAVTLPFLLLIYFSESNKREKK